MATVHEISLSNIGPIERLSIPIPEDGGVVVLRGSQGSGKSTALRAIAATAGGGKANGVTLRDGATRGAVEWGGAKLSVTRARAARSGELEIETIEGRYDIGALVDPQIIDPERADAARIKQLIALTGAKADPSVWKKMIGDDQYDLLGIDDSTDDPIELYSRVVRALQAKARADEKESAGLRVAEVPVEEATFLPVDEAKEVARQAEMRLVALQSEQKLCAEQKRKYDEAVAEIDNLKASYNGPSVKDADARLKKASEDVKKLQAALDKAKDELSTAEAAAARAKEHADRMASVAAVVAKAAPASVSEKDIAEAQTAVLVAGDDLVAAIKHDRAVQDLAAAKAQNSKADQIAQRAERWRKLSEQAESMLGKILPTSDIRVSDGRLVVATDRSANELYAELSHGERAILAIKTAAKFIPKGGVATISQEMWASISDANKKAISDEAKALGVVILTAEVTDEPLDVATV